jgi:hypothetical protein
MPSKPLDWLTEHDLALAGDWTSHAAEISQRRYPTRE